MSRPAWLHMSSAAYSAAYSRHIDLDFPSFAYSGLLAGASGSFLYIVLRTQTAARELTSDYHPNRVQCTLPLPEIRLLQPITGHHLPNSCSRSSLHLELSRAIQIIRLGLPPFRNT
ncbi:hypothetical protein BDW74DRAFT_109374 [Aspergillus multicolor]|uniref:uncharacterized protein n=1 Tax=Aspergillus multicolor TaxID=41759 RepID=UPI003CCD0D4B